MFCPFCPLPPEISPYPFTCIFVTLVTVCSVILPRVLQPASIAFSSPFFALFFVPLKDLMSVASLLSYFYMFSRDEKSTSEKRSNPYFGYLFLLTCLYCYTVNEFSVTLRFMSLKLALTVIFAMNGPYEEVSYFGFLKMKRWMEPWFLMVMNLVSGDSLLSVAIALGIGGLVHYFEKSYCGKYLRTELLSIATIASRGY